MNIAEQIDAIGETYRKCITNYKDMLKTAQEERAALLEAAILCRKHMYLHASNTDDNAFDKLCAAIEKATGANQ